MTEIAQKTAPEIAPGSSFRAFRDAYREPGRPAQRKTLVATSFPKRVCIAAHSPNPATEPRLTPSLPQKPRWERRVFSGCGAARTVDHPRLLSPVQSFTTESPRLQCRWNLTFRCLRSWSCHRRHDRAGDTDTPGSPARIPSRSDVAPIVGHTPRATGPPLSAKGIRLYAILPRVAPRRQRR